MAATIGGSLFAAFAFSGAGWLFHKLDKGGYDKEMKRHNLAMEHLSKGREQWYEEEVRDGKKKTGVISVKSRLIHGE